jgi:Trk-type K+ transport system membrane component
MNLGLIQRIVGIFLMGFSVTMLPPVAVALIHGDGAIEPFVVTFTIALSSGFLLWFPQRAKRRELRVREGFLVVVLFWLVTGSVASLPFLLAEEPGLDLALGQLRRQRPRQPRSGRAIPVPLHSRATQLQAAGAFHQVGEFMGPRFVHGEPGDLAARNHDGRSDRLPQTSEPGQRPLMLRD